MTSPPLPPDALVIVPVRNTVLFPGLVLPITVGRPRSVAAAQQAVREQRQVGILMQRDPEVAEPTPAAMHRIGTVANIVRYVTAQDGSHHLVCQGDQRFQILEFLDGWPFLAARVARIPEPESRTPEIEARFLNLQRQALEALQLLPQAPPELLAAIQAITSPAQLADLATAYMDLKPDEKQEILETIDVAARMEKVSRLLAQRIEVLRLSQEIGRQTKAAIDERQREVLLREQLAAIRRQLGEGEEGKAEIAELGEAIGKAQMPKEVEEQARKELRRLERMPEASAEHGMVRSYLDWLIELPWSLPEEAPIDIAEARRILDEDHYGLDKIKRRIIEYLAVRKLAPQGKAPILCLVGPPGVGKTSLGQSIARAMGRKFVRVSLGGVHDEAEIRGHRRTYIGALPGNIIQAIRKAGTRNCATMLDEIDKLGAGIHGDPSAALLEVLDPSRTTCSATTIWPCRSIEPVGVHHHGKPARYHSWPAARPHGGHRPLRLHGQREARDRSPRSAPAAAGGERARGPGRDRRRGAERRSSSATRARPACAASSARSASACATPPCASPKARARPVRIGVDDLATILGARSSRARWRCAQRAGRRHRPRLDAGWRRHPLHRGDAHARQRQTHPDRAARRGHARGARRRRSASSRTGRRLRHRSALFEKSHIHVHVPAGAIVLPPERGVAMFMALCHS